MVTFEKTFYTNLNATPLYCRIQLFSSFKLFFLWIPNLLEKKSPPTPVLWHQMYPIMERHLYHRHSVNCQVLTSITFILSFSLKAFQKFRHSWLTCLAVQGSSISRSLCLTVRAYQTITRVILAGHFPKMFYSTTAFRTALGARTWEREKTRDLTKAWLLHKKFEVKVKEPGQEGLLNFSSRCHGLICPGEPEAVWPNLLRLVNRASSISPLDATTSRTAPSGGDLAQSSGWSSGPPHFSPQSATVLPMPPFWGGLFLLSLFSLLPPKMRLAFRIPPRLGQIGF